MSLRAGNQGSHELNGCLKHRLALEAFTFSKPPQAARSTEGRTQGAINSRNECSYPLFCQPEVVPSKDGYYLSLDGVRTTITEIVEYGVPSSAMLR